MGGSVVAPAWPDSDGRFGGACPSHARCAGCCTQRRVGDAPRPIGRLVWFVGRRGPAEFGLAVVLVRWASVLLIAIDIADDDLLHVATAPAQHFVHRRAGIGAQMKSVRHLDRLRRTPPSSFGVGTGSIANNDLHTGVAPQPIGEDLGGAIVEQVNWLVRFQI